MTRRQFCYRILFGGETPSRFFPLYNGLMGLLVLLCIGGSFWRGRGRECKKICVTGILTNLLKGQQNAIIRRTHRPTAGGLLQP